MRRAAIRRRHANAPRLLAAVAAALGRVRRARVPGLRGCVLLRVARAQAARQCRSRSDSKARRSAGARAPRARVRERARSDRSAMCCRSPGRWTAPQWQSGRLVSAPRALLSDSRRLADGYPLAARFAALGGTGRLPTSVSAGSQPELRAARAASQMPRGRQPRLAAPTPRKPADDRAHLDVRRGARRRALRLHAADAHASRITSSSSPRWKPARGPWGSRSSSRATSRRGSASRRISR